MTFGDRSLKRIRIGMFPPEAFIPTLRMSSKVQGNKKEVIVVAVEGGVKDWAAYCETPSCWEDLSRFISAPFPEMAVEQVEEFVASHGQKLIREEAELLFPEWAEVLNWRH